MVATIGIHNSPDDLLVSLQTRRITNIFRTVEDLVTWPYTKRKVLRTFDQDSGRRELLSD